MNDKDDPIIKPDDPIITEPLPVKHDPVIQPETESTAITVDTESTLTPISRKEIPQVDAADWENLTVGELYGQMEILEQRKYYCQRHSPMIVDDIIRGITRLELIIKRKHKDEIKLI